MAFSVNDFKGNDISSVKVFKPAEIDRKTLLFFNENVEKRHYRVFSIAKNGLSS